MKRSLSWRLGHDLQRTVVHTPATQMLTGDLSEWEVAKLEKIMLLTADGLVLYNSRRDANSIFDSLFC